MKIIYTFPAIVAAATLFSGACQKKEPPSPAKKGSSLATAAAQVSPPAEKQAAGEKPAAETKVDHVGAVGADELIKKDATIVVIDVRTPAEYASGHLPGSLNIDFTSPAFATEVGKLSPAKTYLVLCQSGGRSTRSLDTFKQLGVQHLIHLDGGMMAWEKEQLPVEK